MSALYDADQDAPALVLEHIATLRNTVTNETFRVRVLRDLRDRYVVGSTRKGERWIAPLMKAQWEIAHSTLDKVCVIVALSILGLAIVFGVGLAVAQWFK